MDRAEAGPDNPDITQASDPGPSIATRSEGWSCSAIPCQMKLTALEMVPPGNSLNLVPRF